MENVPGMESVSNKDRAVLRTLATRVAAIAHHPVMDEKRARWKRHNAMRDMRPIVLIETVGVTRECMPDGALICVGAFARTLEKSLRLKILQGEVIRDDTVIDPFLTVPWEAAASDYGVAVSQVHGVDARGNDLAYVYVSPIKDLERELDRLKPRAFTADRAATYAHKAAVEEVVGDILPVHIRGAYWWTLGLTQDAIKLIGLESLMLNMYDAPDALHALMAFLRDEALRYARYLEDEGLLCLNNGNDYVGSGTYGFTTELPGEDYDGRVRMGDLWALSESQETVGVSPSMFAEFILPYQKAVAERFGMCYYGCCEPVHARFDAIETISNLRSVSVSPWCDERVMAERLRGRYIYSRKPSPTLISTGVFDENAIRADIRGTLALTRDMPVELIMKDVHTVAGDTRRLRRWVEIAYEEAER